MKAITTIKNNGLGAKSIYNTAGDLIATASKILKRDNDCGMGEFRICIYGGPAHGKIAYANDFQDLNDKSVEIAAL